MTVSIHLDRKGHDASPSVLVASPRPPGCRAGRSLYASPRNPNRFHGGAHAISRYSFTGACILVSLSPLIELLSAAVATAPAVFTRMQLRRCRVWALEPLVMTAAPCRPAHGPCTRRTSP